MDINTDFSKRIVMHADEIEWVSSPMPGVDRRMLDRIGAEVARATSIVRYAAGSHFSPHVHDGGEEFIVLEGVFQDEHGDYPAGSYVRNPPTSSHIPKSETGCTIFVKLWQFDMADRTQIKIDMNKSFSVRPADRSGVFVMPLFQDALETVQLETWDANSVIAMDFPDGGELLVLEGAFEEAGEQLCKHSWLRIPPNGCLAATVGNAGARVWIKSGNLRLLASQQHSTG